ncbi:MAG TPA: succinate dehydrogenase cytochrome b subunit [Myxococcota bacterium]|nr:succinate dehydrogenase cytochrome b subunit [Myxococcota bacterium]HRY96181.1 succinate dehydrogenase cytochrome b subunit [Myxococcota bacterium]
MSQRHRFLGSSVGRKALMATTGLLLCAFLLVHLIGNVVLLLKDDGSPTWRIGEADGGAFFQGVMAAYGHIPPLLLVIEILLAALFLTHITLGLTLWFQNIRARGPGYVVHKAEGGRTWGSATMPYTGAGFIGAFLVIHLVNFRFSGVSEPRGMYELVVATLSNGLWAAIYGLAVLGLMLHLSHGVQSAFQSLGLNHERWTPKLKKLGWAYALLVLLGFGCIPALLVLKGVL